MLLKIPSIHRRNFIVSAASAIAAAILPTFAIKAPAAVAPAIAKPLPFDVKRLAEYFGDGDYGSFMGVYAKGHIDPLKFVQHIDMDEFAELVGEDEAEAIEANQALMAEAELRLAGKVKHQYARFGNDDNDCGCGETNCEICREEWFLPAKSGDKGAFPVTVIDA